MLARKYGERRRTCRLDVDLAASFKMSNGQPVRCKVRNISSLGAMIEIDEDVDVPAQFEISLPALNFSAACEVRHRLIGSVGVRFTSNRMVASALFASPYGSNSPSVGSQVRRGAWIETVGHRSLTGGKYAEARLRRP